MTEPPDRDRVEALFEAALELKPASRPDFVAAACGGDDAMRRAVLALLSADARGAGVLERDPRSLMRTQPVPDRLGVYRVLRELGRGGMGIVYDAERDDGQFRRRVAIKIIQGGDDPDLQQRVLAERQILAALDHPHIARLLDGGVADDGRPYLVMEHVEGLPVDVYCDRMRLTVAERLQLFIVITRAVAFAHHNLVLHRDLKPSNILVTPDGRVKLLDFGVATMLNPGLTQGAVPVARERQALTPEYASPEQLHGEGVTITTDVYSLGVVLYELLTGRRPFEQHEDSVASFVDAVCNGAVERPSARVLRPETLRGREGTERTFDPATLARARHATPPRLSRKLHGDVDAICEMALRAEPLRRYASPEQLAQDIENHLTNQPVLASGGGRAYALGKLLRRHRLQAAAVLLTLASIITGAGTAVWQARVAQHERVRAETALAESERLTQFMLDMFRSADPATAGTEVVTARDLVRRATARADELSGQPHLQARMLGALGSIREGIGDYEEAQRLTERALVLRRALNPNGDAETGDLMLQLGILQRRRGQYDSAHATFVATRELQARVYGGSHPAMAATLAQLASIAIYRGDHHEAERIARETVEFLRRTQGEAHPVTVNAVVHLSSVMRSRGEYTEAERLLREAIVLREQSVGSTRAEILNDRLQLANIILKDERRQEEGERMFRNVLAGLDTDQPDDIPFYIWAKGAVAGIMERRGDVAEAERMFRELHELRARVFGPRHPSTAGSLLWLAELMIGQDRLGDAESLVDEADEIYREVVGERHRTYSALLLVRAKLASARGEYVAADSLLARADVVRSTRPDQRALGNHEVLRERARVRMRMGDYAFAELLLHEALDLVLDQAVPESTDARELHLVLAELYGATGRSQDAERHTALARNAAAGPTLVPPASEAARQE